MHPHTQMTLDEGNEIKDLNTAEHGFPPLADQKEEFRQQLRLAAHEYHEFPTPGKISVTPTKQLTNQRDLALAYSQGVASACEEFVVDPANAFKYSACGNLVAVITNGTDVLEYDAGGSVDVLNVSIDEAVEQRASHLFEKQLR